MVKIKKKDREKAIVIVLIVMGVFLLNYYGVFSSLTIISHAGSPLDPVLFFTNIGGISVEGETTYLGTLKSSNTYVICGESDGGTTIYNNPYIIGDSLSIESEVKTSGVKPCTDNYISVKMNLPKGVLSGNVNILATESQYTCSRSNLKINSPTQNYY
jgi:hypothetical protein